ncbi:alpha-glucosidase [Ligilactobacillus sp. WC1T17]|uniref:Alpha-glucosidase n=1 Tax=Ligilactobacillus ruminis TaxID=1623 RepID=A0ABY1ACF2_9LACO|nr:alpha-glucosidase [Ligilactobacillus ruminis]
MGIKKYQDRIIYQVYPKSFKDANGDGIGDLRGVISKLDYLKDLGINTLWLNPIFVSPQVDNGYDVSNYYALDEKMGTLRDFDELVKNAHKLGIDVILDFVVNHTSDQHPWFKDALANPDSLYRDYYIWQKGRHDALPNNWGSFFGGSVWEKDPQDEDSYYFHLFDKRMPDLNWRNPEVRRSMIDIAKFWIDHGVDGFRLDAFIHIAKADFAQNMPSHGKKGPQVAEMFFANLPLVQTYLHEFIHNLREYKADLFILGEAASADIDLAVDYTDPKKELCDTVVTFRYFENDQSKLNPALPAFGQPLPLRIDIFKDTMVSWQKRLQGISYPTLYLNNHDLPRILTKVAKNSAHKKAAAKMLATLMYLQRGLACVYYGEEIGMEAAVLDKIEDFEDQQATAFYHEALKAGLAKEEALKMLSESHKMASRTPMQWNHAEYYGFSATKPWKYGKENGVNVADEQADPSSILNYYRQVLHLKQKPLFIEGNFVLEDTSDDLYVYTRMLNDSIAYIICNLCDKTVKYQVKGSLSDKHIVLQNGNLSLDEDNVLTLAPFSSLVFMTE